MSFRMPRKTLAHLKSEMKEGHKIILFPDVNPENISFEQVKQLSLEVSQKKDDLYFLGIPNFKGLLDLKSRATNTNINLLRKTKTKSYAYLNEATFSKVFEGILEQPIQEHFGIVDKELVKVYSTINIDDTSKRWMVKALKIPYYTVKKTLYSETPITEYIYYIIDAREYIRNFAPVHKIKAESIEDLSLVWDFSRNQSIYSMDELYLILGNLIYVEEGNCAMNLILCGWPDAKKSSWMDMLSYILKEEKISSVNSTAKGLVPSFKSSPPQLGALLMSKYVTLLDDFFRFFSQQSMNEYSMTHSIQKGLEQLMYLLERKEHLVPSGTEPVKVHYKSSFFATDNFGYGRELQKIYVNDPAILKRFSWLLMSRESNERGQSVFQKSPAEIIKLTEKRLEKRFSSKPFHVYDLMLDFARREVGKVVFDEKIFYNLCKRYDKFEGFTVFNKLLSVIKSTVVLNSIIEKRENYVATENDYRIAERLLNRITKDFKTVVFGHFVPNGANVT